MQRYMEQNQLTLVEMAEPLRMAHYQLLYRFLNVQCFETLPCTTWTMMSQDVCPPITHRYCIKAGKYQTFFTIG